MKEKLSIIRNKVLLLVIALLSITLVGTTFAWTTWDLSVKNELQSRDTEIQISEDFEHSTGKKVVSFKNEGSSSVFLRVAYAEFWEEDIDGIEQMLSNTTADGREIALKSWTDYWYGGSKEEWEDGGDGWYYYKKILKPGQETEEILTRVDFIEPLPDYYKKEFYHLFFKAEAVQCSDGEATLNSDEVNRNALQDVFHKLPSSIDLESGTVDW